MKIWILALMLLPGLGMAFQATPQQNCTDLDLRNSFLGENRNQQDVAWCYAFSAADMLNHTFNERERISAADIAISYNETGIGKLVRWLDVNILNSNDPEIRQVAHQTGFNKTALIKAMKEGWCPESVFPSESWTKVTRGPLGLKSEQVPLARAMLEIAALFSIKDSLNAETIPYYYQFKNVDAATFVQLLKKKNLPTFYSSLRRSVCREDREAFSKRWRVQMFFRHPQIFAKIGKHLESGRLVGLDYDSRLLESRTHRGMKLSELHTSSLVGRRWNHHTNTCEYLVRDSYGTTCDERYDSTYDCESGNIWLSESLIYPSMISVVYMLSGKE